MSGTVAGSSRGRGRPRGRSHLASVLTEPYLRREYETKGRSTPELAAELACSPKTVLRYLQRFGIPVRDRGRRRPRYPELRSTSFLHQAHVRERRSPAQIAAELGCSRPAVVAALQRAGLSGRATATALSDEALRDAYERDGSSTTGLAAQLGCAPATVGRRLRRAGAVLRPRGGRAGAAVRTAAGAADTPRA